MAIKNSMNTKCFSSMLMVVWLVANGSLLPAATAAGSGGAEPGSLVAYGNFETPATFSSRFAEAGEILGEHWLVEEAYFSAGHMINGSLAAFSSTPDRQHSLNPSISCHSPI